MEAFKQNAVSRSVWPWTEPEPEPPAPSRLKLVLMTAVAWAVAALLYFKWHHLVMPLIVVALSSANLAGGLWYRPLHDGIMQGFLLLGRLIGWILTGVLLVPFFYLVFAPVRLILLARGKDPMHRKLHPDRASYWIDRPPSGDRETLRRQG